MEEMKRYWRLECPKGHKSDPVESKSELPHKCGECGIRSLKCKKVSCYIVDGKIVETEFPKEKPDTEQTEDTVETEGVEGNEDQADTVSDSIDKEPGYVHIGVMGRDTFRSGRSRASNSPAEDIREIKKTVDFDEINGTEKRIFLYTGGACLEIGPEDCGLGRECVGKDLFAMNLLISREHAYIEPRGNGRAIVWDNGSMNGTYVDTGEGRRRLESGEKADLGIGDKIWLANQLLIIGGNS